MVHDPHPEPAREPESDQSPAENTSAEPNHNSGGPEPSLTEKFDNAFGSEPLDSQLYLVPTEGEATVVVPPERVGKYEIRDVIQFTHFKEVYLAHHPDLDLDVVVKLSRPGVGLILDEARILARLDHGGIVKVFDAGEYGDGRAFLVEQLITGHDLSKIIASNRPSFRDSAALVARIATALHHVHRQGVFHRDIKPANILVTEDGKPYVTDFGLALRVEDFGNTNKQGGTILYMSPEQARNEGHLVDGRTDIYSLGLVFFELLTGKRVVEGSTVHEVLARIKTVEPPPPRQIDASIPRELERIFLKASAKRRSDRYRTAEDFAADLERFLNAPRAVSQPAAPKDTPIVPKGLRAYDSEDSDFFLELLPGPRDRDGLPESLRFWKNRIVERDADRTFRVGLLYGPSGCGKSSFVKAGLIPLLPDDIACIHVDATAKDTESWLLRRLRRKLPQLSGRLTLVEALSLIREGGAGAVGKKVLIVLDQFEQRLQAEISVETTELVQALRHCDGDHLQCLILARDDFWMPITRFFHELEIPLEADVNSVASDLFDRRHARKVLEAIGRAYGALPGDAKELAPTQERFLDTAVEALSESGQVIPVRLALFAQMVHDRDWDDRTLRTLGGTRGVGVAFLEQTFDSTRAKAECSRHRIGAMGALNALLPAEGQNIKGALRTREELREAAGHQKRAEDFEELLGVLDGQLRLITPVYPEPLDATIEERTSSDSPGAEYFQLTHDYLVPSLRDWLTRKQRETMRGRAQLRLTQRAALWDSRHERRQLPSLFEWINIGLLTSPEQRSQTERDMLRQATRYHATRSATFVGVALLAVVLFLSWLARTREEGYLTSLRLTPWNRLAEFVQQNIEPNIGSLESRLRDELRESKEAEERTRIRLALLVADSGQVTDLKRDMLESRSAALKVIRDALNPYVDDEFRRSLWAQLEIDPSDDRPYHAAAALALFDPDNRRWSEFADYLTSRLVVEEPLELQLWIEMFRNIGHVLIQPLKRVFRGRAGFESRNAAAALVMYRQDDGELLDLLGDATRVQFGVVVEALRALDPQLLRSQFDREPPDGLSEAAEGFARRQSNVAMAMLILRSGDLESCWRRFRAHPTPHLRTFLIHRALAYGLEPNRLFERLEQPHDIGERRALTLAMGSYDRELLLTSVTERMSDKFLEWYETEPDPGLHSAIRWLLGRWGLDGRREALDTKLAGRSRGARNWFVTKQGHTMAILPDPGEFYPNKNWWDLNLKLSYKPSPKHATRMGGYRLAVSITETSNKQYNQFLAAQGKTSLPADSSPVTELSRNTMAQYCNWLSEQEGLESCYHPVETRWELRPDFLKRTGYRLPTYTEWEYACRAGTDTERYFAATFFATEYAWFYANKGLEKLRQGGLRKPNDFGLFDVLGNVSELCECCFDPTCGDQRKRGGALRTDMTYLSYGPGLVVRRSFKANDTGFRVVRVMRTTE